ncbi:hypothetical protein AGDE_16824 [Angomonas deanei]|nr:hypothetical protein AGDE_16824 [Angomonas deanei]|eukprot:EPY16111.1 hypothetical protein AGDE_16824 [Angomonas deanei]
MNNIYDINKREWEEALKEIATLRKEHSDYERDMTASIEKVKQELADAQEAKMAAAVFETKRKELLDEFFNRSTFECDLIGLYTYCKFYRVPEDLRLSVLAADAREELTLPDTLKDDIRGSTMWEFLTWMVVPLPNLRRVIGLFDSMVDGYVQHKKGIVPLPLLKSYCAEYGVEGEYHCTKEALLTVTSVGTCLDYFTTVLPLLPGVTRVKLDGYEVCTQPEDRSTMIGGGSVRDFLTTVVTLLPKLGSVTGLIDSVEKCYVGYKQEIIPLSVLQWYCAEYGAKGEYDFTKEDLLTVTAVGTCLDYFTTALPLLPGVTRVNFPDVGQYTQPEDQSSMIGGGSVRELLATVVDLLPEPKNIWGFYQYYHEYYLAYKAGDISHDVLKAFCYDNTRNRLIGCTTRLISAGVQPVEYCETMLPLLPAVNTIEVGERVHDIGWCAILPERITEMDLRYCRDLKDFSPLLAMDQLTKVVYHNKTNPSFQTIMEALRNKGVSVELKEYDK